MSTEHIYKSKGVNGVVVLKIIGAFTKDTLPELKKVCYDAAKGPGTRGVLLDCGEVSEIDTSAFACIFAFIKTHAPQGINIGIINLSTEEKMLAEILGIDSAIHIFKTESNALDALSKGTFPPNE